MELVVKKQEIDDVQGTLLDERNLPLGSPVKIPFSKLNRNSVKSAIRRLNKIGYLFEVKDDGVSDYLTVTRSK